MNTEVTYKHGTVRVAHTRSSEPEPTADLVISEEGETGYKSLVQLYLNGKQSTVAFLWSHFSDDASFCLHYSEENEVLFLGGGSVSAVVDTSTLRLIDINYPMLFWRWELIKDHILELGETECRLYTTKGKLVGAAQVDPPYEYRATDHSIEFTSIVAGKTNIELMKG